MNPLQEFFRSKRANDNRRMQKALRKLDNMDLAKAFLNIEEKERVILYRNMTRHAAELLKHDIESRKNEKISDHMILESQELVSNILIKFTREIDATEIKENPPLPEISLETYDDIINSFDKMSNYAWNYGLLALEDVVESINHVMFQKGMALIIDGTDPMLVDEVLDNYKKSMVYKYKTKLDMIASGIKAIQMGDNPFIIIEKMKALIS